MLKIVLKFTLQLKQRTAEWPEADKKNDSNINKLSLRSLAANVNSNTSVYCNVQSIECIDVWAGDACVAKKKTKDAWLCAEIHVQCLFYTVY